MNQYLQKLHALRAEKAIPTRPSKPSKPASLPPPDSFEGFEGDRGMGFRRPRPLQECIDRFDHVLRVLESGCPDHVPVERWQHAVDDGRAFLVRWGEQAEALRWTAKDLFGLQTPPAKPHPSYRRLSRYDETGLSHYLSPSQQAGTRPNRRQP
jgi:hypothetical protein